MNESELDEIVDDPEFSSEDNMSGNEHYVSDDIESMDVDDEVVLCLFYHSEKLAAAVYCADSSKVQIMYDEIDIAPDFKMLCSLYYQLKPTKIVTSSSLSQRFLWRLNCLLTGENFIYSPTPDPPEYSEKLHFIPAKEFRYSTCRRSVLELKLPFFTEDTSEEDRHTYIMSLIDLSSQGLISAVGGLLYFLQRYVSRLHLVASIDMPVLTICSLSIKDLVWMDEETMRVLQIFSSGAHPSSFKWSSGKEGFCIYSILNRCHSPSGAKHMRVMLSRPTKDVNVIKKRHEVIDFCLKTINEPTVKALADSIVNIKSVLNILTRMTNAQASVGQWKAFYNTIYNAVSIGEVCRANCTDIVFFQEIADSLCDSIYLMSHCINRIMDFEKSAILSRIVVKEGISDDLDRLRENQANISKMMSQLAEQELKDLPEYIPSCWLTYIPESGYFLTIKFWDSNLTEDHLRSIPNLQYQFHNSESANYKSARCHELDSKLGDWLAQAMEIESKIILKLVQYIQYNISPLVKLTSLIAELDCLLALSKVAQDFNLVRPKIVSDKKIHIRKGRHILQELCVNMFVPNDTHSSVEDGLINILNGPNSSGKSVYLKQIALIVYLAHIGSYVPAETATIGIVDQIHTRTQPVDAVNSQLSSFMTDLRQISLAVRSATSNSLVIIDEFGKGTSEVDGLGILAASVEHFVDKNNISPHIFVSTHFHSLSSLLPSSDNVKHQYLEHLVEKGDLVYLYRLQEGVVGTSFAIQVAQNRTITQLQADRATQILNGLKNSGNMNADSSNKQARLMARRRTFLKTLSIATLDEVVLGNLKKSLVSLRP